MFRCLVLGLRGSLVFSCFGSGVVRCGAGGAFGVDVERFEGDPRGKGGVFGLAFPLPVSDVGLRVPALRIFLNFGRFRGVWDWFWMLLGTVGVSRRAALGGVSKGC